MAMGIWRRTGWCPFTFTAAGSSGLSPPLVPLQCRRHSMPAFDAEQLKLTDFMDLPTLQEIQDSFAAVANVKAVITDADGNVLTSPAPTDEFVRRQRAIAAAEDGGPGFRTDGPQKEGKEYVAPITIGNQRLGTLRMVANPPAPEGIDEARLQKLGEQFGLDIQQMKALANQLIGGHSA